MKTIFFATAGLVAVALVILIQKKLLKVKCGFDSAVFPLVILPFWAGGFYTFLSPCLSLYLLWFIIRNSRKKGAFILYRNEKLLAIGAMLFAAALSPLWAADRGMCLYGVVKTFPFLLYMFLLMQLDGSERGKAYAVLPVCGAAMTLLCVLLQFVPVFERFVTVNHRLSGFFEYPNVYAAFLLVCLAISGTQKVRLRFGAVVDAVLIFGIFGSGSRTAFVLLLILLPVLMITRREKKYCLQECGLLAVAFVFSYALSLLGGSVNAARYLTTSSNASTFLGRILYFKDALPVIAHNPLGLGFWGYYETQGSFQTGVYTVAFVHNELLQQLLDYGWIPTALLCFALVRSFFAKRAGLTERFVMGIILAHSMMDFDLQFSVMWLLLLFVMDLRGGKKYVITKAGAKMAALAVACVFTVLTGWLGLADACYQADNSVACLRVNPFHTQALEQALTDANTTQEMDELSTRILKLNKNAPLAHNAQANVFFSQGNVAWMITEKERAIQYDRYSLDEYCDYIGKLYTVMQLYQSAGDNKSAEYCRNKILSVPAVLERLRAQTDPLAWRITDKPSFDLPEDYQKLLEMLKRT